MTDKKYCMSSFLMFRIIADRSKNFGPPFDNPHYYTDISRQEIENSFELEQFLRKEIQTECSKGNYALALSGGIDSAILAKFVPKGTIAYTFKCVVPGRKVTDETAIAARYAKECGLEHRIVEVYWEDFVSFAPALMKKKQAPIHSIEVQILKAGIQAKNDGFDGMIYGETADCVYGGHSSLLSKDWTIGEFIDRWSFVKPYKVLKDFEMILDPYIQYEKDGYIDAPRFLTDFEFYASLNSYLNATSLAGIQLYAPYAYTRMKNNLDLKRVRTGENKYLIRELFSRLYPGFVIPPKTPMPRPMNEWMEMWKGPERDEFWPNCTDEMTGDQKWLIWALEQFLNIQDIDSQ